MMNKAVYCQMRPLSHNCLSNDHPYNNNDKALQLVLLNCSLCTSFVVFPPLNNEENTNRHAKMTDFPTVHF